MKKIRDYTILFLLLLLFVGIFKYSLTIKSSVLNSIDLWLKNLVPSMLPLYLIIDLLINYGLPNILYKITGSNSPFLTFLSYISGTPSNAKYISDFYEKGFIGKNTGNLLLLSSYSPNPLFIIAVSPNLKGALSILSYIYLTNFFIYLIFKPSLCDEKREEKKFAQTSFIECLSTSIAKSFDVLILVLGVVVFFGILTSFLEILNIDSDLLSSILELTNALNTINSNGSSLLWMAFATSFGGLSIHVQIKSIIEKTDLSYRYFLLGRLLSSLPILAIIYLI